MSKKEVLRDLQQRLAQRLQEAADADVTMTSWLAVEVAGQGFLLPLGEAGEIFPVQGITPVPHVQPWFLGVASLRGSLHAAVDLARFFGLPPVVRRNDQPSQQSQQSRLITFNANLQINAAVLVDDLLGLRHMTHFPGRLPDAVGRPSFVGARYADAQGRVWQELSLTELALNDHFLNIRAAA